ncbi:MAG: transglutaminase family protein, partial [Candidatus Poribacteria bacterium]
MLKQSITIFLTLLLVVFTTYADEMSYEIRMFGRAVGYTHYQLEHRDADIEVQTTVLFNLGQGDLDQEIKLVGNTRLNAQTFLPIEYHLSTYINGFTQSTIDTQFENHIATQVIAAGGHHFNNQIELPKPTYIADNNFRVDHYNIVLGQYDFEKRGTQFFYILVPLAVPQLPEAVELALTWVEQDQINIGNTVYQTDRFEAQTGGTKMEFWYAQESKQIVKWTIPSQETVVILSDSSMLSQAIMSEDHSAILRRTDLPRIVIERDMGNASDLASLQAHLDLNVVASGKPPIDLSHQVFDGEMSRDGEHVHINGEVTVRLIKYAADKSMPLPIAGIDFPEPYLQPTPQIESDHPEIQAKAEGITASAQTAYEATKAIIEQTSREIRYNATTVSAHKCLSTKVGDALSNSRLSIALLRSLKIPARLLGGLL